jgi:hypothetical protein
VNNENKVLTTPTIHLNGSSAFNLAEEYRAAYSAVGDAIRAVQSTAPNGRDYYVQGPDALGKANAEHLARLQRLSDVQKELEDLGVYCLNGGKDT